MCLCAGESLFTGSRRSCVSMNSATATASSISVIRAPAVCARLVLEVVTGGGEIAPAPTGSIPEGGMSKYDLLIASQARALDPHPPQAQPTRIRTRSGLRWRVGWI